jgi:hypothetical protein
MQMFLDELEVVMLGCVRSDEMSVAATLVGTARTLLPSTRMLVAKKRTILVAIATAEWCSMDLIGDI